MVPSEIPPIAAEIPLIVFVIPDTPDLTVEPKLDKPFLIPAVSRSVSILIVPSAK
jgi:hypothetical protein